MTPQRGRYVDPVGGENPDFATFRRSKGRIAGFPIPLKKSLTGVIPGCIITQCVKIMQRVIKKYSNRKLYDTRSKSLVSLSQVAKFIEEGEEVLVIDHRTGEDITSLAMAQIILSRELTRGGEANPSLLRDLIRRGRRSVRELVLATEEATAQGEEKVRRVVADLVEKRKITKGEGRTILNNLMEGFRLRKEALETYVEAIIRRRSELSWGKEFTELRGKVNQLSQRVEELIRLVPKLGKG